MGENRRLLGNLLRESICFFMFSRESARVIFAWRKPINKGQVGGGNENEEKILENILSRSCTILVLVITLIIGSHIVKIIILC